MSIDRTLDHVARREARRRAAEDLAATLADRVEALAAGREPPSPTFLTETHERWFTMAVTYADRLAAGDLGHWHTLLAALAVNHGLSLSSGPGGRLMAMSPYAGKAAVILDESMGFGMLRGDAVGVARQAVEASGRRAVAGTSYLILVEPDALAGAAVIPARRG